MSAEEDAGHAADDIRAFAAYQIRCQLPYLKDDSVEEILDNVHKQCYDGVIRHQSATEAAKKRINFFKLPGELRNKIYEMTLAQDEVISLSNASYSASYRHTFCTAGLTAANRQVRREALPIYYSSNAFSYEHLGFLGDEIYGLKSWLRRIGPELAGSIKKLEVVYGQPGRQGGERYLSEWLAQLPRNANQHNLPAGKRALVLHALGLRGFGIENAAFTILLQRVQLYPYQIRRNDVIKAAEWEDDTDVLDPLWSQMV